MGDLLFFILVIPLGLIFLPFLWLLIVSIADKHKEGIIKFGIILLLLLIFVGGGAVILYQTLRQFL